MKSTRLIPAGIALSAVLALAGCGGGATAQPSTTATPAPTQTETATPSPTPTPTPTPTNAYPTAETISCDTMLDPALDVQLRSEGLLPAPKPFTMLSFQPTLPSIECPWGVEGDYHSFVYYTWTQLAPGERDTFLVKAGQSGMSAERVDGGTWLAWGSDAPEGTVGIMLTDEWAVGALTPADVANVVWTR